MIPPRVSRALGRLPLLPTVAAVGWGAWYLATPPHAPYNPAVFAAFRTIENACLAERFPHQTVRCKAALSIMQSCASVDRGTCSADEYHEALWRAGFDLPPLTLPQPPPP